MKFKIRNLQFEKILKDFCAKIYSRTFAPNRPALPEPRPADPSRFTPATVSERRTTRGVRDTKPATCTIIIVNCPPLLLGRKPGGNYREFIFWGFSRKSAIATCARHWSRKQRHNFIILMGFHFPPLLLGRKPGGNYRELFLGVLAKKRHRNVREALVTKTAP